MARSGLGPSWTCAFANDIDPIKSASYLNNWRANELLIADVNSINLKQLPPGRADLAWASFPCQDLSLAGNRQGMGEATRSGVFWGFWRIISNLAAEGREPSIIALENVVGWLKSRLGQDFASICSRLAIEGYQMGAVIVDAAWFVPQSRPRVFLIAVHRDLEIPKWMQLPGPDEAWHGLAVVDAWRALSPATQANWVWWRLQRPIYQGPQLHDIIEDVQNPAEWDDAAKTKHILGLMDENNRAKVISAQLSGLRTVGALYRRVRPNLGGGKTQRAEVRFDGLAGCLRTPSGGSSRQAVLIIEGDIIRSRLLTRRETARLMGLPDTYRLPERYNDAYHLTGDGVAVPVVRHLAERIFEPLLAGGARVIDKELSGNDRNNMLAMLDR